MKVEKNLSRFDSRDRKGKMHEMNGTKKTCFKSCISMSLFLSRFAGNQIRPPPPPMEIFSGADMGPGTGK